MFTATFSHQWDHGDLQQQQGQGSSKEIGNVMIVPPFACVMCSMQNIVRTQEHTPQGYLQTVLLQGLSHHHCAATKNPPHIGGCCCNAAPVALYIPLLHMYVFVQLLQSYGLTDTCKVSCCGLYNVTMSDSGTYLGDPFHRHLRSCRADHPCRQHHPYQDGLQDPGGPWDQLGPWHLLSHITHHQ